MLPVMVALTTLQAPAVRHASLLRARLPPLRLEAATEVCFSIEDVQPGLVLTPRTTDDGYNYATESSQRYGGSAAWFENLRTTFQSRVLQNIATHLASTFAFAVFFSIAFGCASRGLLPGWACRFIRGLAIPALPHSAVGGIVGLLLAFRTNQAYQRFWEARTLWDGIYSKTRGIVRLATAADFDRPTPGLVPGKGAELLVGLAAAYPYALKQHLRGERDLIELIEAATTATGSASSPAVRPRPLPNYTLCAPARTQPASRVFCVCTASSVCASTPHLPHSVPASHPSTRYW